jgi:hypothetical protein
MQTLLHIPVIISLYQGKIGFILVCAMPREFGQIYQYCILIRDKVIRWTRYCKRVMFSVCLEKCLEFT